MIICDDTNDKSGVDDDDDDDDDVRYIVIMNISRIQINNYDI